MGMKAYWCVAVVLLVLMIGAAIQTILNVGYERKKDRWFMQLIFAGIVFILLDVLSKMVDGTDADLANYIINSLYFSVAGLFGYMWVLHVIKQNDMFLRARKSIIALLHVPIVLNFLFSSSAYFNHLYFYIDENHFYKRGPFLWMQVLLCGGYLIIAIVFGVFAAWEHEKGERANYYRLVGYTMVPIVGEIIQLCDSDIPGITIAIALIYSYVCVDSMRIKLLESANQQLEQERIAMQDRIEHQNILSAYANIYYAAYLVDIEQETFTEVASLPHIHQIVGEGGEAKDMFRNVLAKMVLPRYADAMLEFALLATLQERMRDKDLLSMEFEGEKLGWSRMNYIAARRDDDGLLTHVLMTFQHIDAEKRKELDKNRQLEEALDKQSMQLQILNSLGDIYLSMFFVNLKDDTFYDIGLRSDRGVSGRMENHAARKFEEMCWRMATPDYTDQLMGFADLTSVGKRLRKKAMISIEFIGRLEGYNVWCRGSFIPVRRDDQDNATQVLFVVQKIEEEKKKEMESQRALMRAAEETSKANAVKTEFMTHMSHDIRTPINGIMGMLDISKRNINNQEIVKDCNDKILKSSEQLLSLVNDVLDMSKIESGEIDLMEERFNIDTMLDMLYTSLQPMLDEYQVVYEQRVGQIYHKELMGSPVHVRKVLQQILTNAIKYNRIGGKVIFTIKEIPCDDELSRFEFRIEDTGVGISDEFKERVYDTFAQEDAASRTKYVGTGLGLSIVRALVNEMNGEVHFTSQQGVGSVFVVSLPFLLDVEEGICAVEVSGDNKADVSGMRALLVEDNELNRINANYLLSEVGVEVVNAENGEEGIEIFEQSKPGTFDIILMDVMMPVMDGYEATRRIRELSRSDARNIPIVALTASVYAEDVRKAQEAGMNGHLAKPFVIGKVISVLEAFRK